MENKILSAYENRPRTLWSRLALGAVLVALMAWSATAAVDYTGASGGGQIAASIISGILHPDLSLLFNFTTEGVPYLMLETICIAFLGTVVGAVLAVPLSFLTASNLVPKPIAFVGRMAIMAIRTVPSLVYGLMFVRVTGMGAFAGLMTMALSSIGMVSKMYIEAIEDLDVKILESLDAAGCTTFQKIRYGILPQLIPNFASTAIYRFDINLRLWRAADLCHERLPLERSWRDPGGADRAGAGGGIRFHQDPCQAGTGLIPCILKISGPAAVRPGIFCIAGTGAAHTGKTALFFTVL